MKSVMGMRQFLMLGLDKVRNERILACRARNLKCMAKLRPQRVGACEDALLFDGLNRWLHVFKPQNTFILPHREIDRVRLAVLDIKPDRLLKPRDTKLILRLLRTILGEGCQRFSRYSVVKKTVRHHEFQAAEILP